jgi:hypothetical protein
MIYEIINNSSIISIPKVVTLRTYQINGDMTAQGFRIYGRSDCFSSSLPTLRSSQQKEKVKERREATRLPAGP